jgi:hypothetical protein
MATAAVLLDLLLGVAARAPQAAAATATTQPAESAVIQDASPSKLRHVKFLPRVDSLPRILAYIVAFTPSV